MRWDRRRQTGSPGNGDPGGIFGGTTEIMNEIIGKSLAL